MSKRTKVWIGLGIVLLLMFATVFIGGFFGLRSTSSSTPAAQPTSPSMTSTHVPTSTVSSTASKPSSSTSTKKPTSTATKSLTSSSTTKPSASSTKPSSSTTTPKPTTTLQNTPDGPTTGIIVGGVSLQVPGVYTRTDDSAAEVAWFSSSVVDVGNYNGNPVEPELTIAGDGKSPWQPTSKFMSLVEHICPFTQGPVLSEKRFGPDYLVIAGYISATVTRTAYRCPGGVFTVVGWQADNASFSMSYIGMYDHPTYNLTLMLEQAQRGL